MPFNSIKMQDFKQVFQKINCNLGFNYSILKTEYFGFKHLKTLIRQRELPIIKKRYSIWPPKHTLSQKWASAHAPPTRGGCVRPRWLTACVRCAVVVCCSRVMQLASCVLLLWSFGVSGSFFGPTGISTINYTFTFVGLVRFSSLLAPNGMCHTAYMARDQSNSPRVLPFSVVLFSVPLVYQR